MESNVIIERTKARVGGFYDKKAFEAGLNFKPRPTDVVISTSPKSGTTWVQQICHGLRSNGDINFEEIDFVVPCLELAECYGYGDLQQEQTYPPRMFKTHFWYHACPKGFGKCITVVRNPADSAVSLFRYFENWFFKPGEILIDDFVRHFSLSMGGPKERNELAFPIQHIDSWYPHRLDQNVLWLHYEDLKADLPKCVKIISDFLGIGVGDQKLLDKVTHQASFEFMREHKDKFMSRPLKLSRNKVVGMDDRAGLENSESKVRKGSSNSGKTLLSPQTLSQIEKEWNDVITASTGYATYEEFRVGINKELGRDFSS